MSDYGQLLYMLLLVLLQSGVIGALALALRQWTMKHAGAENYRTATAIAYQAAQAIEQMAKTAGWSNHGKLDMAIKQASSLGAAHGITLTPDQWRVLIESGVKQLHDAGATLASAPPATPTPRT